MVLLNGNKCLVNISSQKKMEVIWNEANKAYIEVMYVKDQSTGKCMRIIGKEIKVKL